MDFARIKSVVDGLAGSAAAEVRVKNARMDLHIRFAPVPPVPEAASVAALSREGADRVPVPLAGEGMTAASESKKLTEISAPMPGMIYLAPSPSAARFIEVGASVKAGDTLLLIEAMKSMLPIQAPCDGVVELVLVDDEDMVDAAQTLIQLRQVVA